MATFVQQVQILRESFENKPKNFFFFPCFFSFFFPSFFFFPTNSYQFLWFFKCLICTVLNISFGTTYKSRSVFLKDICIIVMISRFWNDSPMFLENWAILFSTIGISVNAGWKLIKIANRLQDGLPLLTALPGEISSARTHHFYLPCQWVIESVTGFRLSMCLFLSLSVCQFVSALTTKPIDIRTQSLV